MRKEIILYGFTLFILTLGLSGCMQPRTTDYFNGEYDASENTILNVTTFNGQIEIYKWDNDKVSLNAVKKTVFGKEELDFIDIIVEEDNNQIDISAKYIGDRVTQPTIDMNIKVPSYVTVESATTSNGAIQIQDVKGDIVATTSNGAIVLENIDGYVTASTSNGRIDVTGTTGVKNLHTSNMGINVEIYDFKENISITASNGAITVYINTLLNADIEMKTSNGQISVSEVTMQLTTDEEKHIIGKLGSGGKEINISTSNGNVNLYKLET
jgi:hypothetical protein